MQESGRHQDPQPALSRKVQRHSAHSPQLDPQAIGSGKVRVLIADDQAIACEVLKRLLKGEDNVELVGICSNGPETLDAINRLNPDLVFLDVQMPGMDGFEVVEKLPPGRSPMVVFVTANETFAARASKTKADFVVKPCTRERIRMALRRTLSRSGPPPGADEL